MHVSESSTSIAPELREFIERYEAAWDGHDPNAISELLTEDVVWTDPALPEPARGIPAVREFMRSSFVAFPDLSFSQPDPPAIAANGDVVMWAWHMRGTNSGPIDPPGFAATGRTISVDGVDQWTMRDGRIAVYRAYYDMNDLARQLGLVPPAGSRAERGMIAMQRLRARFSRR